MRAHVARLRAPIYSGDALGNAARVCLRVSGFRSLSAKCSLEPVSSVQPIATCNLEAVYLCPYIVLFYILFYSVYCIQVYRCFVPVYGNLERVSLRVSTFHSPFENFSLPSVISFSLRRFITVWHAFVYARQVFLSDNCSFEFVCFSIASCMSTVWLYVSRKLSTFHICTFLSIAFLPVIYILRILFHLVISVLPWFIAVWHAPVHAYSVFIFCTWSILWNLLLSWIF